MDDYITYAEAEHEAERERMAEEFRTEPPKTHHLTQDEFDTIGAIAHLLSKALTDMEWSTAIGSPYQRVNHAINELRDLYRSAIY